LLDRLPLQIRSRRWDCRRLLYRLSARWRGRRSFITDGLAIVVSDHHDHQLGFSAAMISRANLRPFAIAALIVTDETGISAMFAHDANLGFLGKGIFKPIGKPISVRIAHHHDLDRGILARRGRRGVGVIPGAALSPLLFPLRGEKEPGDNPSSPIGDSRQSRRHRDCTAAAGASPMNFPRTAHWQEAREQK
jgi:hypothetical protein